MSLKFDGNNIKFSDNSSQNTAWTGNLPIAGVSGLQNALDDKAPLTSPSFTGTVSGITKNMVGLSNVDNTSDLDKPISNLTQSALNNKSDNNHNHSISDINNLQSSLDSKQAAGSYAHLVNGKVPPSELPSYVDEVLEYANLASFPDPGSTSKIYVDLSNNKIYRWSGAVYVQIDPNVGTTDGLVEGNNNLYFTNSRASAAAPVQSVANKTGAVTLNKADVDLNNVDNTSDLDKPISNLTQNALNLKAPINNPTFTGTVSGISKNMVGLNYVDNTSDLDKPISNATQNALNNKENSITAGTSSQYYRGDKTWQTLNKSTINLNNVDNTSDLDKPISNSTQNALDNKAPLNNPTFTGIVNGINKSMIGLNNVDNTSDLNKPISTLVQAALDNKENSITAGTSSQYYRGDKTWQTLDKTVVGLNNVDNTSDLDKPISVAVQNALNLKANSTNTLVNPGSPGGRLTIVSNTPVVLYNTSTGVITGSTLYYTPYNGNLITLYDNNNTKWNAYFFDQLSLSVAGLSVNTNFDIFLYNNNNNVLTLYAMPWASNNSRGSSWNVAIVNGVIVSGTTGHPSGVSTYGGRYLGTIRTTSTGTIEDTRWRQFIWNYNNPVTKRLVSVTSASHTYSSTVFRPVNNTTIIGSDGGRSEVVIGYSSSVSGNGHGFGVSIVNVRGIVAGGTLGIGVNGTTEYAWGLKLSNYSNNKIEASTTGPVPSLDIGYNYLQLLEAAISGYTANINTVVGSLTYFA